MIRGLRFQGGSSGVRFVRGHHVTIEGCEIFETGNNALTMNSGDCQAFVIRSIFNCSATGITAAPHAAAPRVRNVAIVHNTIFNTPVGVRLRWSGATHAQYPGWAIQAGFRW